MSVNNYLDVLDELKSVPDTNTDKLMRVAGVITDYVKEIYDIGLIVVGGLSVEIYTDGGYTTQDIDFVGVNHEKIMQALSDLGFRREGRNSIHDELKVFVEVPDSVLKDADEHYVRTVTTEDGFELSVIGVEDIIKSRLMSYIHHQELREREWAYNLIKKYRNEIDLNYIENTLTENEWGIFLILLNTARKVNESEKRQFELILFLEREGIPHSISDHTVVAFPVKVTYYGISLAPIIRAYEINEDDIFVPVKEEMTVDELISWIRGKEIPFREEVIHYIQQLYK